MKENPLIKAATFLREWFKFNLIAPRELKIKRIKRNNHYLLFFSAAFGLFGLVFCFITILKNGFKITQDIWFEFNYYSSYVFMAVIIFPWCFYLNRHPEKIIKQIIQPIHFGLLAFLTCIFLVFHNEPTLNAYIILVCVTVVIPVAFFIEPIVYDPMVTILLCALSPKIHSLFGTGTMINNFLFLIVINILAVNRWRSVIRDFNHEQKQAEYINNLDNEIALASQVQKSFFKHNNTIFKDWAIAHYNKAMAGVSGDFFDIYNHDDELEGIGIFDVSGHGIASGLVTMLVKNIINSEFQEGKKDDLLIVLERINQNVIKEKGDVENYLTGILLRINENKVSFVTAGHSLPILYRAKEDKVEYIQADGQKAYGAIGMKNVPSKYAEYCLTMNPGDELIFFTDGITDAKNEVDDSFGKERLLKSAKRNVVRPLNTQIDCIISDVKTFSANVPQNDDITLVILEKK
ncbi:MAG: serine/threonine-protein phosphatase [Treponema sp.]|nr:serine/threonine-protein phosphatase [Treponema sp.]